MDIRTFDVPAAWRAVSSLEVMYNHGYSWAAIWRGSVVRDKTDSSVFGWETDD